MSAVAEFTLNAADHALVLVQSYGADAMEIVSTNLLAPASNHDRDWWLAVGVAIERPSDEMCKELAFANYRKAYGISARKLGDLPLRSISRVLLDAQELKRKAVERRGA